MPFYDMLQCQEMVSGGALFGLIWTGMFLFSVCILETRNLLHRAHIEPRWADPVEQPEVTGTGCSFDSVIT